MMRIDIEATVDTIVTVNGVVVKISGILQEVSETVVDRGVEVFPLGSEQNPAKNRDELPDGTGLVVNEFGDQHWYKEGKLHREDGPAVEYTTGDKRWYQNGQLHRVDGPALEWAGGSKEWWVNGKLHRVDGPAVEWSYGDKEWYLNGELHREDGPALEYSNGENEWFQNGERHRVDGPAVEWATGEKVWYKNGVLHREDGPAVEGENGDKEWWVNGEELSEAEFLVATQKSGKNEPKGMAKDSTITPDEFPLGSEQNPAKNRDELPDGTGLVINLYGAKEWYVNGQWHREDGPAIECANGEKYWYQNGERHREDGPAVEWTNGYKEWYLDGEKLSEAEFIEWSKGTTKTTDSAISPDEFPVGSEQNPAKNLDELPNGTGVVMMNSYGSKEWYLNGELHREDGPAVEGANGTKAWYKNGALHREDGPAVQFNDGNKMWYVNGRLHREDGPAVDLNGSKEYWLHGEYMTEAEFLERSKKVDPKGTAKKTDSTITPDEFPVGSEQNPAKSRAELPDGTGLVVYADGDKHWYKDGVLHREDGPALEWSSGTKFWIQNGGYHRVDGPAVERASGSKEWWVNGVSMSEAEFLVATQRNEKNDPERTAKDSTITSDESPVGSELNPAKNWAELPDGTGLVVNFYGTKFWYLNGELHRESGPAVEAANGSKAWYKNGRLHRKDGPAIEWADGSKEWYLNGEELSEAEFLVATQKNGNNDPKGTAKTTDPTITHDEFPVGSEQNPAKNRAELPNGTGIVMNLYGTKAWYKNWRLHCEDGPAIEWSSGTKFWIQNGKKHRVDGPAVERASGSKEWYLDGEKMTEAEFHEWTKPID